MNFFGTLLDYINPFSEKFILKDLLSFIGSILDYLNPFSENFILKNVFTFLGEIISYINPFSENFFVYKLLELLGNLLKFLFVPSDGFFSNKIDNLKLKLSERLPYEDYVNMFETVKQVSSGDSISVGLNNYNFGNGLTYDNNKFVDFSWITNYKETWYMWVRGVIFILLIIYNLNQIMKVLRGYNIGDGISKIEDKSSNKSTEGGSRK